MWWGLCILSSLYIQSRFATLEVFFLELDKMPVACTLQQLHKLVFSATQFSGFCCSCMCYRPVVMQRQNRKLLGCVGPQVRSHRTKERKRRWKYWGWNWATFPRPRRQTFTIRGYKGLMEIICVRSTEILGGSLALCGCLVIYSIQYISAALWKCCNSSFVDSDVFTLTEGWNVALWAEKTLPSLSFQTSGDKLRNAHCWRLKTKPSFFLRSGEVWCLGNSRFLTSTILLTVSTLLFKQRD